MQTTAMRGQDQTGVDTPSDDTRGDDWGQIDDQIELVTLRDKQGDESHTSLHALGTCYGEEPDLLRWRGE